MKNEKCDLIMDIMYIAEGLRTLGGHQYINTANYATDNNTNFDIAIDILGKYDMDELKHRLNVLERN